jgi:hypothetical protein
MSLGPLKPDSSKAREQPDTVIVTTYDLEAKPPAAFSIRPWFGVLFTFLSFCMPLLCVVAIGIRVRLRHSDDQRRKTWDSFLCVFLIISGLITSVACGVIVIEAYSRAETKPSLETGLPSLDRISEFPQFPSPVRLTAEQISEECNRLVFILAPDPGRIIGADYLNFAPIGGATLLLAARDGYLLATSQHVIDAQALPFFRRKDRSMLLFSQNRESSAVEVVGRNPKLDLALLWMKRSSSAAQFRQPIAHQQEIRPGETVFAIGHPQRLFYTLSSGLISRTEDPALLQFSAPVSPGNSGGPLYDSFGRLLGIVASMVDRGQSPNAENLNFAVRAEAFLLDSGWDLTERARVALSRLRETTDMKTSELSK